MSDQSAFAIVRSLITVGQVQFPVQQASLDDDVMKIHEDFPWDYDNLQPLLILDRGSPVGWLDPGPFQERWFEWEDQPLREAQEELIVPIHAEHIVSAGTPLVDAALLFAERQPAEMQDVAGIINDLDKLAFFFVLENSQISGIVQWGDLFKAPGRLCFFALTLELEEVALDLCAKFADKCWNAISEGRQKKALQVHSTRYNNIPEEYASKLQNRADSANSNLVDFLFRDLIDSTTFIDKADMITKCNLLLDFSNQKVKRIFSRAERIRNACAHPPSSEDGDQITTPSKLAELIRESQLLISEIKTVTPR